MSEAVLYEAEITLPNGMILDVGDGGCYVAAGAQRVMARVYRAPGPPRCPGHGIRVEGCAAVVRERRKAGSSMAPDVHRLRHRDAAGESLG